MNIKSLSFPILWGQAPSRKLQFEVTNYKMYAYYRIIILGKASNFIYLTLFFLIREH